MSPSENSQPKPGNRGSRHLSQAEIVDTIRQAILANNLAPGQRLIEAELCEQFNSSRGTIRAALVELVHEGLVERVANRGARVRIVGLEEALQVADVRLAVETLCAMRAAERISDAEVETLRGIARRMEDYATQNDVVGFAEMTHLAFETYVDIAQQDVAKEVLARLRDRMARHRLRLTYRQDRPRTSLPYWLDIIDAICRRDPVAVRDALHRHVENIKQTMISLSADERTPSPMAL